jgi:hypothetical protein
MAKSDLEAQTKSSLSDCTWLERMSMGLDLEILLKFPNVAREPESFIIYIFFFILFFFFPFLNILFLIYIYRHTRQCYSTPNQPYNPNPNQLARPDRYLTTARPSPTC